MKRVDLPDREERLYSILPDIYEPVDPPENLVSKRLPHIPLMGLDMVNGSLEETLDWLEARIEAGRPTRVAFLNAHCANQSARNETYRAALCSADAVLPDGSGIALALRLRRRELAANLNGTDLIPALCDRLARQGRSVYLLGGTPGVAEAAAAGFQARSPGLRIAGTHDGFFSAADEAALIDEINASGADVLLVAMGVPAQDLWLCRNAAKLKTPLTFGVGALLDFMSGRISRAPALFRRAGLEWTWRLYLEPARMWRRYVIGNPEFVARSLLDMLRSKVRRAGDDESAGLVT